MLLVAKCADYGPLLNIRIFKQVSVFLRELSNDNEYVKSFDLASGFAQIVEDPNQLPITVENVDFFWNCLEFHFNVITEKEGRVGIYSRLNFYLEKIQQLLRVGEPQATDPVTFFKANFLSKYKLADMFQQAQKNLTVTEEEVKGTALVGEADSDEEEKDIMTEAEDEDKVAKQEPQFKDWMSNVFA